MSVQLFKSLKTISLTFYILYTFIPTITKANNIKFNQYFNTISCYLERTLTKLLVW